MDIIKLDFDWFDRAEGEITDPLLGSIVCRLGKFVNNIIEAVQEEDPKKYFDSVLGVCRTSQHLRLHVGDLSAMGTPAIELVNQAFNLIEKSFVEPEKIEASNREEYKKARQNIRDRRMMTEKDNQPIPFP